MNKLKVMENEIEELKLSLQKTKSLYVREVAKCRSYAEIVDFFVQILFGIRHKFTNDGIKLQMLRELIMFGQPLQRKYKRQSHGVRYNSKEKERPS